MKTEGLEGLNRRLVRVQRTDSRKKRGVHGFFLDLSLAKPLLLSVSYNEQQVYKLRCTLELPFPNLDVQELGNSSSGRAHA